MSMVVSAEAPRPIRGRVLARGVVTMLSASGRAVRKGVRRQKSPKAVAAVYVGLLIAIIYLLGPAVATLVVVCLVAFTLAMCALIAAGLLGAPLLSSRRFRAWTDERGTLVVTARLQGRGTWKASNLSARPAGQRRSGAFIASIVEEADQLGVTINAKAGDMRLYQSIYRPHGFLIVKPGPRPKITRAPKPRAALDEENR